MTQMAATCKSVISVFCLSPYKLAKRNLIWFLIDSTPSFPQANEKTSVKNHENKARKMVASTPKPKKQFQRRKNRANSDSKANEEAKQKTEKESFSEVKQQALNMKAQVETTEMTRSIKMIHYEHLMWLAESQGNHLEAQQWHLKLQKLEKQHSSRTESALKQVKHDNIQQINDQFQEKCDKLVKDFAKTITQFNQHSVKKLEALKSQQSKDVSLYKLHLAKSYNAPYANKELKELREIEYFLGQKRMFQQAYQVQLQIKQLEDEIAKQYYVKIQNQNKQSIKKLQNGHDSEMQRMMKKLEAEKTQLYIQFQNELNIMHTWKENQLNKIESQYTKDLDKLNKNILTFVDSKKMRQVLIHKNGSIENARRVSQIEMQNVGDPLRDIRRKQGYMEPKPIVTFIKRSTNGLRERNEFYETKHKAKIQKMAVENAENNKLLFVCQQHVFGTDDLKHSNVITIDVIVDKYKQEIRWSKHIDKRGKRKNNSKHIKHIITCKMPFDQLIHVLPESQEPIFNQTVVQDKKNCLSVIGKHSSLHIEMANSQEIDLLLRALSVKQAPSGKH